MYLGFGGCGTVEKAPPEFLEKLSEKLLNDLWSASFGSVTPQDGGLCARFQQFRRATVRGMEGCHTVLTDALSEVRMIAIQQPRHS